MRVRSILVALGLLAVFVLAILWGMGGQKTAQGAGSSLFGDGSDGTKVYSSSETDTPKDAVVDSGTASSTTLVVSGVGAGFVPGEKILIHQTRGTGVGAWEINEVQNYGLGNIITANPLSNSYASGGSDAAQVLVLREYTDVTVNSGVTVTAKAWNPANGTGGIFAFLATGTVTLNGTISATGKGFIGGTGNTNGVNADPNQGEGHVGPGGTGNSANGSGGGGGGRGSPASNGGGGGGGHQTPGGTATGDGIHGVGGGTSGNVGLTQITFGGGGGEGTGPTTQYANGGAGGGIVMILGANIVGGSSGLVTTIGADGTAVGDHGSAGGAGGSILLNAQTAPLGTSALTATGGTGRGTNGVAGDGGDGYIRLEYCTSFSGGISDPPASLAQISCGPKPTPTKQPFKGDTDGDGCPDQRENGTDVALGGQRDYLDPWDWYDVNQDGIIDLFTDILGVINHYSLDGSPPYDAVYDRGPVPTPPPQLNPWKMTAPDGIIDLFVDILGVIGQYSLTGCT